MSIMQWILPKKQRKESLFDAFMREHHKCACKKILLLEDDSNWRDLVREFSTSRSVEFMEAPNSSMARYVMETSGPIDAAIIDVGVTNGDGIVFYRWIRKYHPKTFVVFLTGASIEEVYRKTESVGAAPVFRKEAFITPQFIEGIFDMLGADKRATT